MRSCSGLSPECHDLNSLIRETACYAMRRGSRGIGGLECDSSPIESLPPVNGVKRQYAGQDHCRRARQKPRYGQCTQSDHFEALSDPMLSLSPALPTRPPRALVPPLRGHRVTASTTSMCWRGWLLPGNLAGDAEGPQLAGLGHRSDETERPLIGLLQSSTREGLLRILEPPFLAADRSAVNDPLRTSSVAGSGHSNRWKLPSSLGVRSAYRAVATTVVARLGPTPGRRSPAATRVVPPPCALRGITRAGVICHRIFSRNEIASARIPQSERTIVTQ
jgi:hypothetical protein